MLWMMGARMTSLSARADGIWVAELQRSAGTGPRRAWVVWSPTDPTRLVPPASWRATYWQDAITGVNTNLAGGGAGGLPVGDVPVLVAAAQ